MGGLYTTITVLRYSVFVHVITVTSELYTFGEFLLQNLFSISCRTGPSAYVCLGKWLSLIFEWYFCWIYYSKITGSFLQHIDYIMPLAIQKLKLRVRGFGSLFGALFYWGWTGTQVARQSPLYSSLSFLQAEAVSLHGHHNWESAGSLLKAEWYWVSSKACLWLYPGYNQYLLFKVQRLLSQ